MAQAPALDTTEVDNGVAVRLGLVYPSVAEAVITEPLGTLAVPESNGYGRYQEG